MSERQDILTHRFAGFSLALVLLVTSVAAGNSIRLRDQAVVTGDAILLRHVAEITGELAESLADITVMQLSQDQKQATVMLVAVRAALVDRGANLGKLSVQGFAQCRISRSVQPPTDSLAGEPAPVLANPREQVQLESVVSLRHQLIQWIMEYAGYASDELRIEFAAGDAALLSRSAVGRSYEIEPLASGPLGRLPLVVKELSDGQIVASHRLFVDVSRRCMAVVAVRDMTRGHPIVPGDVELREVYTKQSPEQIISNVGDVIGKFTKGVVKANTTLLVEQVRNPIMVRRGDLISVRCVTGGVVVSTVARAQAEGTLGEVIRVINERSREQYDVQVVGMKAGLLNLDAAANVSAASGSAGSQEGGAL